mmetsp:Transcript_29780/g.75809  ORF Transcript_29780/g.75809 Transcript_29780/m.75809 type:complete len:203 (+) Transcript_29780:339-947(+)
MQRRADPGQAHGLQPPLPDGQYRHGLLQLPHGPRARRPHGLRDPARLRPRHRQRRLLPLRGRHGLRGPRPGEGWQVPPTAAGLPGARSARRWRRGGGRRREVLRREVEELRELAHPARLPGRGPARGGREDVQGGPEGVPAVHGREPSRDGLRLGLGEGHEHHPLERLPLLRGDPRRPEQGARRLPGAGAPRQGGLDRHPEG